MIGLPRHRTVADVMTTKVHVASPTTPFKMLVRLIEENRVSAIPIVDQAGFPVGIVSESDLLLKERRNELETAPDILHPRKRQRERAKSEGVVASEIMSSPAITTGRSTTIAEAARMMQHRSVRRLVVVDERGKIAGIVSRSDLLNVFLRTDEELFDEVVSQLVPALLVPTPESLRVSVEWNVVTLAGEVERRSDAAILVRQTRQLDGVVEVVDRLRYKWDDSSPTLPASASLERSFPPL